jgi:hypothetical protein
MTVTAVIPARAYAGEVPAGSLSTWAARRLQQKATTKRGQVFILHFAEKILIEDRQQSVE